MIDPTSNLIPTRPGAPQFVVVGGGPAVLALFAPGAAPASPDAAPDFARAFDGLVAAAGDKLAPVADAAETPPARSGKLPVSRQILAGPGTVLPDGSAALSVSSDTVVDAIVPPATPEPATAPAADDADDDLPEPRLEPALAWLLPPPPPDALPVAVIATATLQPRVTPSGETPDDSARPAGEAGVARIAGLAADGAPVSGEDEAPIRRESMNEQPVRPAPVIAADTVEAPIERDRALPSNVRAAAAAVLVGVDRAPVPHILAAAPGGEMDTKVRMQRAAVALEQPVATPDRLAAQRVLPVPPADIDGPLSAPIAPAAAPTAVLAAPTRTDQPATPAAAALVVAPVAGAAAVRVDPVTSGAIVISPAAAIQAVPARADAAVPTQRARPVPDAAMPTPAARPDPATITPPPVPRADPLLAASVASPPARPARIADEPLSTVPTAPTPGAIHQPVAVAAAGGAQQAGVDLTRDPGLHRMIDRIETLRDNADSRDTRIRLIPDALGPVDVSVRREGEAVHVHFAASEAATRQLIADAQPRLAELAEARGVRIDRATVDGGATGQPGGQPGQTAQQPGQQTNHNARPNRAPHAAAAEADSRPETDLNQRIA